MALPVLAADLDNDPPVRHGSAYDDPRYADLYGSAPPIPRERVYRYDDRREDYRWDDQRRASACASKDVISSRLERDGWGEFTNPQVIDRARATVDARRPNGRPFRLEVDRCSGEILATRPLDAQRYGSNQDRYGNYADGGRRPSY